MVYASEVPLSPEVITSLRFHRPVVVSRLEPRAASSSRSSRASEPPDARAGLCLARCPLHGLRVDAGRDARSRSHVPAGGSGSGSDGGTQGASGLGRVLMPRGFTSAIF